VRGSRVVRALGAIVVAAGLILGAVTLAAGPLVAQTAPQSAGLPEPQPTPEESRQAADEILAEGKYQEPAPSFIERFFEWIGEWLRRLQPRPQPARRGPEGTVGGSGGADWLTWVMVAILVVIGAVVVSRLKPGRRRKKPEDDPLELSESEIIRAPDQWIAEAERLEREEQWKAALLCRFQALIGELLERGVVRDLPGRTSGEFRADVRRSAPELTGSFAEASYLFDDAWYGDTPTGRSESEAFRRLAAQVLGTRDRVGAGS
jgi:hypothetical protein